MGIEERRTTAARVHGGLSGGAHGVGECVRRAAASGLRVFNSGNVRAISALLASPVEAGELERVMGIEPT